MISKENIKDIFGLSPMQKNMIYSYAVNTASHAYLEQFDFHIEGELIPEHMQIALKQIVKNYDIFRTVFSYRNTDEPRQVVLKEGEPQWQYLDVSALGEQPVLRYKEEDLNNGFDLSKDVLIRGALFRVKTDSWRFILTFHHIILDGWSLAPILEEFFQLYLKDGNIEQTKPVDDESTSFSRYIKWLESKDHSKAMAYWKDYLKGYEKKATIPDYNDLGITEHRKSSDYQRNTYEFKISENLTEKMKQLAYANNTTVNVVFQTAWGVLLQKYNYSEDVVYGMIVSGRSPELEGVELIKGLFINAVPIRIKADRSDSFITLSKKVQQNIMNGLAHEYYPLPDIQSHSELRNNLLDHVMAFENYPLSERLQDTASQVEETFAIRKVDVHECSDYDFNIIVIPGKELNITFIYNENRYCIAAMEGLSRSIIQLLEAACSSPETPIRELCLCSNKDREELRDRIKQNQISYPSDKTVDKIFSNKASEFKHRIAVIHKDKSMTYEELELLSEQLKIKLLDLGVKKDDFIGVLMPRCPEYVVSILGILKAGAAYVPIDLANSKERMEFIISDSNMQLVCTLNNLKDRIKGVNQIVCLDSIENMADCNTQDDLRTQEHRSEGKAYMMYTSGSTGNPKGCIITHRNIINLLFGQDYIDFGPHQVIMQIASPAFDVSTFEIWGSLLYGGTLVLPEEGDITDSERLKSLIAKRKVTSMVFTSSLFNRLCDADPGIFHTLRSLTIGGEPLSVPHLKKLMEHNPELQVINAYGPTENTTYSTIYRITEKDLRGKRIPIGKPLTNSHAYVVDKSHNLLPAGAIGELCVGGDGVGLGYHKRDELTNKRFVMDQLIPKERMYLTGDLVRMLPDGTIDIFDRIDNQVKIRGFRIELGEIEHAMRSLPNLKQVTVQVKELNGEQHLCSYYTADGAVDLEEWKQLLMSRLPKYMLPAFYVELQQIPVTENGKVNSKLLPFPQIANSDDSYITTSVSELEDIILDICASVVGVDKSKMNTNTNFFDMGITSLNMISINNRINKQLNRSISLSKLFEYNTISKFKNYLSSEEADEENEEKEQASKIQTDKNRMMRTLTQIRNMEG